MVLFFLRRAAVWTAFAFVTTATLHAQPRIDHSGLNCMRPGELVVVLSEIDPEGDIRTAKVYFRSSLYRDFYYVEMTYQDGRYVGILPQPSAETPRVIYYVEALDSAFNTARSREYDADVRGRCRQEPAAAYFPGGDPGITVGATAVGASSMPPGFMAVGIAGTITAAGLVSGVGGGIGAGTAVAVGAALAASAGAAVLTTGGDDLTTSSVVTGMLTSSVATTTSIMPAGSTSSTTAPGPGPVPTTTTPGAPTTTVPGGSTTTSVATSTTSVTTSTTPGGAPLEASCFTVEVLAACGVRVDATCVALPVDRYEWILDLNNRWRKVEFPDGPHTLTHTWDGDDCDAEGETLRFRLKVRRDDLTSTAHKNLFVPGDGLRAPPAGDLSVRLHTHLRLPGRATGRVSVNATPVRVIDNASPVELRARSRRGSNTLVAVVATVSGQAGQPGQPGTWRFALEPIVPGSLRIVSGNVLTQEPNGVVFRLAGHVGERIELTFVVRE